MKTINPIILTYEDGTEYTLEFDREAVSYAEKMGFSRFDVNEKMMTRLPELFFYAFRMHHPTVTRKKTDQILFDDLGGVSASLIERLGELFSVPYDTLVNENGTPKNSKLTVNL